MSPASPFSIETYRLPVPTHRPRSWVGLIHPTPSLGGCLNQSSPTPRRLGQDVGVVVVLSDTDSDSGLLTESDSGFGSDFNFDSDSDFGAFKVG